MYDTVMVTGEGLKGLEELRRRFIGLYGLQQTLPDEIDEDQRTKRDDKQQAIRARTMPR
jgi:hypothetical protein